VQHLFTRRLPGFDTLPYKDRLSKLQLPTLELRRLRSDLVLCFKIINGMIAGPAENYGLAVDNRAPFTRGHDRRLLRDQCRVDVRQNFFGARIPAVWNSLPGDVVNASSVLSFKNGIEKCDLSSFLKLK